MTVTTAIDALLNETQIPVSGTERFDVAAALRQLAADASRRTPAVETARAAQAGQRLEVVCRWLLNEPDAAAHVDKIAEGQHGLIHGELGPDHALVDDSGHPVLIDIEGLMFSDVEWEHVLLQLRFGDQYSALSRPGLHPARLDLYMLAIRLSLVAVPLRLLDGDFPHRTVMQEIAEHNAKEAPALSVS